MPYNGSGAFVPLPAPTYPAVAGEIIYASRFNAVMNDIMAGLSQALTRDGQSGAGADIPFNSHTITGLRPPVNAGEPLIYGQNSLLTGAVTNDFRPNITLVKTVPQGTSGEQAASLDFVIVAVQTAVTSAVPVVSQSHEALGILKFYGA